jgi:hypothetical protein
MVATPPAPTHGRCNQAREEVPGDRPRRLRTTSTRTEAQCVSPLVVVDPAGRDEMPCRACDNRQVTEIRENGRT